MITIESRIRQLTYDLTRHQARLTVATTDAERAHAEYHIGLARARLAALGQAS